MTNSLNTELKQAKRKSAKPMLWVSMISMTMMFAGLTSAYVVSRKRDDWVSFDLPDAFFISTILIILSSITFYLAKHNIKKAKQKTTTILLTTTFILGAAFIYFQLQGFNQLVNSGLFFTGEQSTVKSSFIYGITGAHIIHIIAGLIVVSVVLFKNLKGKYTATNYLGLELGEIFWHFVDALWIYLIIFFYFIR
ncbi:MAG TPA: cytochrome c oxidase subunit 3 [Flavobacteriaceae bacterium]|nr:cytochrome c oxidase subunit 3 [Flavobacteriaceae bacterium]